MSTAAMTVLSVAPLIASLPYWLPPVVVRLRMMIFTRINGGKTLQVPSESLGPTEFRRIYEHPGAHGRSQGARLSDLFWYWLSPGPELHQEHLEDGPRYQKLAGLTRKVLAIPRTDIEALVEKCAGETAQLNTSAEWRFARLRDMVMPFWARFFYELVFRAPCSDAEAYVVEAHAKDVASALKCTSLRHMVKRNRLTTLLMRNIEAGLFPHPFPIPLSPREQAHFLQGVFFTTGVTQMSDATAHLLMVLAQHPKLQQRLFEHPDDKRFYNHIVSETLRKFPLFGIAHRITSEDIEVGDTEIKRGSVVCFNYPEYHKEGFTDPDDFQPDRWEYCSARNSNYIPFGIASNRPCPAQGLAVTSLRRLTLSILDRYQLSTSADHTRSMPNRGPCLLIARNRQPLMPSIEHIFLLLMTARDRWENAFRSIAQLVFGTIMVIDARRLRLCENHFRNQTSRPGSRKQPACDNSS